jgi:hypothetical protein
MDIDTSSSDNKSDDSVAKGSSLATAPIAERDGDAECDQDGCGGSYVLYDGDRVCRRCGHLSGTDSSAAQSYRERHLPEAWQSFERQRSEYNGFTGDERIKFVGGFVGPWVFEDDL